MSHISVLASTAVKPYVHNSQNPSLVHNSDASSLKNQKSCVVGARGARRLEAPPHACTVEVSRYSIYSHNEPLGRYKLGLWPKVKALGLGTPARRSWHGKAVGIAQVSTTQHSSLTGYIVALDWAGSSVNSCVLSARTGKRTQIARGMRQGISHISSADVSSKTPAPPSQRAHMTGSGGTWCACTRAAVLSGSYGE